VRASLYRCFARDLQNFPAPNTPLRGGRRNGRGDVDATSINGVECAAPPGEDDIGGPVLIRAAAQATMPLLAGNGFREIL
jgi:NADH:quinone reductase (non-electrogenic)